MHSNCIKSLEMGFGEEEKKSEIRFKSEFSHPWWLSIRCWLQFFLLGNTLEFSFHFGIMRYHAKMKWCIHCKWKILKDETFNHRLHTFLHRLSLHDIKSSRSVFTASSWKYWEENVEKRYTQIVKRYKQWQTGSIQLKLTCRLRSKVNYFFTTCTGHSPWAVLSDYAEGSKVSGKQKHCGYFWREKKD